MDGASGLVTDNREDASAMYSDLGKAANTDRGTSSIMDWRTEIDVCGASKMFSDLSDTSVVTATVAAKGRAHWLMLESTRDADEPDAWSDSRWEFVRGKGSFAEGPSSTSSPSSTSLLSLFSTIFLCNCEAFKSFNLFVFTPTSFSAPSLSRGSEKVPVTE